MTDLPVPKAEAKPSTWDLPADVLAEAHEAYSATECYGTGCCGDLDTALRIAFAAGRAQAAADIRDHRGSLDGLAWQERAAQLAEAGLSDALKLQSDGPALQETPEG